MKKNIAVLLLFCYSLALLKPVMPVVQDAFAHTFWKLQHLATVHYENGSYHVHMEMKNAAEKDGRSKEGRSNSSPDENFQFHLNAVSFDQILAFDISISEWSILNDKIPFGISPGISTPPPWIS